VCECSPPSPCSLVCRVVAKERHDVAVEQVANRRRHQVGRLQRVVGQPRGEVLVEALVQDVTEDDVINVERKAIKRAAAREDAAVAKAKAWGGGQGGIEQGQVLV
jgi:hypothetical protein